MDLERFENSPIGKLVQIQLNQYGRQVDHCAFLPAELPTDVDLEAGTYAAIENAAIELGLLEGSASQLTDPYLVSAPAIRQEAQSTSALEGTISDLEEVFAADLEPDDDDRNEIQQRVREVVNYVDAAEEGVRAVTDGSPVSLRLLNRLHSILLAGTENAAMSGEVRPIQVAIGSHRGQLVTEARFVPPPPGTQLLDLLSDWEKWNYRDDDVPLIARLAVSHYQFETIYPYTDGNGRIGRLAVMLLLIDRGALSNHYMTLSPYIESRRTRYVSLLAETSETGDFNPWTRFFAEILTVEAHNSRRRISALIDYRDTVVTSLRSSGLRGLSIQIAEDLITHPVLTPRTVERRFEVSYQTANRAIGQLVQAGVMRETTGGSYARRFRADEIFNILTAGFLSPATPGE